MEGAKKKVRKEIMKLYKMISLDLTGITNLYPLIKKWLIDISEGSSHLLQESWWRTVLTGCSWLQYSAFHLLLSTASLSNSLPSTIPSLPPHRSSVLCWFLLAAWCSQSGSPSERRVLEIPKPLNPSSAIYQQCDPEKSHKHNRSVSSSLIRGQ